MVEEFTSTRDGMAEFQRERVILELAILIRRLLKEKGLTKADLAARLGRSKAFVTQLLNGRANMTIRTASDVLCVLGHSLNVGAGPLELRATVTQPVKPAMDWQSRSGVVFNTTLTPIVIVAPKIGNSVTIYPHSPA